MDVRNLQFKDGTFDVVIDKALLDALVCGDGAKGNTETMLKEIHRVLSPTGTYICISHGAEIQRKKYLKNVKLYNWNRVKFLIPKPVIGSNIKDAKIPNFDDKKNFHFMYICRKQIQAIVDSDDPDAVAAEKVRIEAEQATATETKVEENKS